MKEFLSDVTRGLNRGAAEDGRRGESEEPTGASDEDVGLGEDPAAALEKLEAKLLDDSSDHYTNIDQGTLDELFFRTLMEEVPELKLSLDDEATNIDGERLDGYLAVRTAPFRTDRVFLHDICNHPVMRFLTTLTPIRKRGFQLERDGMLPAGMGDRVVARNIEELLSTTEPGKTRDILERELADMRNPAPITDAEAEAIMREVIREEYKKKLGI